MASHHQPSTISITLLHNYGGASHLRLAGVFAAFAAIACYNAIELVVLCLSAFKRRNSTYFWSLFVSSVCIVPYTIGFTLIFFRTGVTPWVSMGIILPSWYGMVTGQSIVLWSRLHLVCQNMKLMRAVLWMICINAVILHIPTSVIILGTIAHPVGSWPLAYDIMERIELVGFCLQEFIISVIYVWETVQLLRLRPEGRPHGILNQLLVINILIVILDITVVIIEYAGLYAVQVSFKPLAYSVKLKLEYAILGKLIAVTRGHRDSWELRSSEREINDGSAFPSQLDLHSNTTSPVQVRRPQSPVWLSEPTSFARSSSSGLSHVTQTL